jgi:hypothetical protein
MIKDYWTEEEYERMTEEEYETFKNNIVIERIK